MGKSRLKRSASKVAIPLGQTQTMQQLMEEERQKKEQWKRIFETLDTDNSGTLEFIEVSGALCSILDDEIPDEELKKQFELIDADSSGGIEFPEFCRLLRLNFDDDDSKSTIQEALSNITRTDSFSVPAVPEEETVQRRTTNMSTTQQMKFKTFFSEEFKDGDESDITLREMFDTIDEDRSGKIELIEFLDILRLKHVTLGLDEIKRQFNIIDSDHNDGLDYNEFKKLMTKCFELGDSKTILKDALNYNSDKIDLLDQKESSPPILNTRMRPRLHVDYKTMHSWNEKESSNWLKWVFRTTLQGESYAEIFLKNGVDGSLLTILDDESLVAMRIDRLLHRRRILSEIKWMMYEIEHPHLQDIKTRPTRTKRKKKKRAEKPQEKTESELFDELDFI